MVTHWHVKAHQIIFGLSVCILLHEQMSDAWNQLERGNKSATYVKQFTSRFVH